MTSQAVKGSTTDSYAHRACVHYMCRTGRRYKVDRQNTQCMNTSYLVQENIYAACVRMSDKIWVLNVKVLANHTFLLQMGFILVECIHRPNDTMAAHLPVIPLALAAVDVGLDHLGGHHLCRRVRVSRRPIGDCHRFRVSTSGTRRVAPGDRHQCYVLRVLGSAATCISRYI